jgi:hypothetical protein
MTDLGFASCKADPDIWIWRALKPDGAEYYECVIFYVGDALPVSLDPKFILHSTLYVAGRKVGL